MTDTFPETFSLQGHRFYYQERVCDCPCQGNCLHSLINLPNIRIGCNCVCEIHELEFDESNKLYANNIKSFTGGDVIRLKNLHQIYQDSNDQACEYLNIPLEYDSDSDIDSDIDSVGSISDFDDPQFDVLDDECSCGNICEVRAPSPLNGNATFCCKNCGNSWQKGYQRMRFQEIEMAILCD